MENLTPREKAYCWFQRMSSIHPVALCQFRDWQSKGTVPQKPHRDFRRLRRGKMWFDVECSSLQKAYHGENENPFDNWWPGWLDLWSTFADDRWILELTLAWHKDKPYWLLFEIPFDDIVVLLAREEIILKRLQKRYKQAYADNEINFQHSTMYSNTCWYYARLRAMKAVNKELNKFYGYLPSPIPEADWAAERQGILDKLQRIV